MSDIIIGNIAPPEFIVEDYLSVLDEVPLRMGSKYRKLLLMQTIIGHAAEGHGEFRRLGYDNTTLDDVVDALAGSNNPKISKNLGKLSKKSVKKARNEVIELLKSPFKRIIAGEDVTSLTDHNGEPLLGIQTLKEARIKNKEAFLIGGYLASKMDNYYPWRKRVEEKYRVRMGGGDCIAVDIKKLTKVNLTLGDLSEIEYGKLLEPFFKKEGIVKDIKKEGIRDGNAWKIKSTDTIKNAYIRHRKGRGVSDDAAVIIAGLLYGEDAFWGAYLFDAIDTWDKYATYIIEGGADEAFGDELRQHINITDDEVLKFIYLVRKGPKFPDSSQRYFLEIDQSVNQTALESHLKFIRGERFAKMRIGYRRKGIRTIKNTAFYRTLRQRLNKNGL